MLRREAARWLVRLQSGRDPDVEEKFRRWRDGDPANAEAFESVKRSYERAGLLRYSPLAAGQAVDEREPASGRTPGYAWAAAAALVVLVPAGAFLAQRGFIVSGTNATMLITGVGEIRRVSLDDGSKVTLDTETRLEVEIGRAERRARLKEGRARFEVAHWSEPFVVEAGEATITSEGSVFDVEKIDDRSRVDVLSGSADVRSTGTGSGNGNGVTLRAGQGVTAEAAGIERTSDAPGGTDWTRGMLQFDGTPLEAAVSLANRYSQQKIVLAGDIARLRVTGAFRAGDTAGLARALAAAFDLSLARARDGNLILSRKSAPEPPKKNGG